MQQEPVETGLQGWQVSGSSSQPPRSGGDPSQNARIPSVRSKKRERSEPVSDPVKQQRVDKSCRSSDERDHVWKPDASSLVGKDGGLCSAASVDRLVYIMQYDWNDCMKTQVDLIASRTMLAKVVAATVELDCLVKFVKLGGLPLLDRWLQEAHRSKPPADNDSSVDEEKACEDLIVALLGALERLPVDLVALKSCTAGKSVNNLRSHRHPDIQRRARKLVDMWKKRVDAEMKQSGETSARHLSMDPSLCLHQQDAEMGGVKAYKASSLEPAAQGEPSCMGRGKFASVASLCSSPDGHNKASSFAIQSSSASICSVDIQSRVPSTANIPAKSCDAGISQKMQRSSATHAYTLSNEEGKVKFAVDFPQDDVCVSGSRYHLRATKTAGAVSHGKNTHKSHTSASSTTTLSGSVVGTKDEAEGGAISCGRNPLHAVSGSSVVEACTLRSCSSCQRSSDILLNYDAPSRMNLNASSSGAANTKEKIRCGKEYGQPQMYPGLANVGINLLANIAASESSMNDVKALESLSEKSTSVHRASIISLENNVTAKIITKNQGNASENSQASLKVVVSGIPTDREHFDRNSSTVSSPSETSTQLDILMGESRKAQAVCVDAPSPLDTTSESSLPSTFVSRDASRKKGSSINGPNSEHGKLQTLGEEEKRLLSQLALVAEAVGESSVIGLVERLESKDTSVATVEHNQEDSSLKRGLKESTSPPRSFGDDPLEVARQVAVEVEQEVVDCHGGLSERDYSDRTSTQSGGAVVVNKPTNASALEDSKNTFPWQLPPVAHATVSLLYHDAKQVPSSADVGVVIDEQTPKAIGSEVTATKRIVETERLVFDLNERLICEEGPVQDCTMSVTIPNVSGPVQDCTMSTPASSIKPTLSSSVAGPMAPIAIVAATKGSFTPPAIPCRPMGELGWKGSAATSAFRPTQPRRSLEKTNINGPEHHPHAKPALDFDLNVAADSIFKDDYKMGNADMALKPTTVAGKHASVPASVSSGILESACEPLRRPVWDLNQADEGVSLSAVENKVVQSSSRLDFDLNNGPTTQDNDEALMAGKHFGMWNPLTSGTTITGAGNGMFAHPISSVTPITIPAFASSNPDVAYPLGGINPWVNSGSHDGLFQYNIYMQSQGGFPSSGMAYPPLPSTAACSYGGFPFGFSPASIQGFSPPFIDALQAPSSAVVCPPLPSTEGLMPSQIKPPYMMRVSADAIQQGDGSFWGRPNLDLNAGPEVADANIKDERRQMLAVSAGLNDQRRARHQVVDMAAVLQHREQQEGSWGMQGAVLKQPVWR